MRACVVSWLLRYTMKIAESGRNQRVWRQRRHRRNRSGRSGELLRRCVTQRAIANLPGCTTQNCQPPATKIVDWHTRSQCRNARRQQRHRGRDAESLGHKHASFKRHETTRILSESSRWLIVSRNDRFTQQNHRRTVASRLDVLSSKRTGVAGKIWLDTTNHELADAQVKNRIANPCSRMQRHRASPQTIGQLAHLSQQNKQRCTSVNIAKSQLIVDNVNVRPRSQRCGGGRRTGEREKSASQMRNDRRRHDMQRQIRTVPIRNALQNSHRTLCASQKPRDPREPRRVALRSLARQPLVHQ